MKSKVVSLSVVSLLFAFAASAQGIENDDMYFNSKDRAKQNAAKASDVSYSASIKKSKKENRVEEEPINPTDSYSARNINPEYEARSNSEMAQEDNQDYFVNNYQYNNASQLNNWNNNFNQWYSRPWYGGNFYDPYINSWNSPYYGSPYDQWGNPWRNPYYRSGWSSSFSYHWGNTWDYGWGMSFGYGNYGYGNPYNAWGWNRPFGYSPWSSYSYYSGGYYPSQVVIINNNNGEAGGRGVAYGKRATSSRTSISRENYNPNNNTGSRTRSTVVTPSSPTGGNNNTGGRVSNSTNSTTNRRQQQEEYYNRSWRSTNSSGNTSRSYGNGNTTNSNTWGND